MLTFDVYLLFPSSDLIIEMLMAVASYSIKVEELKAVFHALKCDNKIWKKNSVKLLSVLKAMTRRYGPDEFFSLPGDKRSVSRRRSPLWQLVSTEILFIKI